MQNLIESRWFAFAVLVLVIASGFGLYLWPQSWTWVLMLPVVMSMLRLVIRPASFQTPGWVAILLVFLATAIVGSAVAYNESLAGNKFCLLVVAVLLYINIGSQPVQNIKILAGLALCVGVGVASWFLLTADFAAQAVKFNWIHQLGLAWMSIRPNGFPFPSIHPNDTAGISIIAGAYGLPLLRSRSTANILKLFVLAGLGIVLFAFILASSRGAFLGLAGALGVGIVWRLLLNSSMREKVSAWFPYIVIAGILILEYVVLFVPSGLLGASFSIGDNVFVSRADVFRSGLLILHDFPFTGGGLGSFPGLYSQYVLGLPYYLLPHSHNMFLNVMIEQGVLGGAAFLLIYLMAVRKLLSAPQTDATQYWHLAACISLFTAIFHGMVDDYLYETSGPVLALVPAGMAILASRLIKVPRSVGQPEARPVRHRLLNQLQPYMIGALVVAGLFAFSWRPIVAQWYANMGAIEMAKIELADFPTGKWSEGNNVSDLQTAALDFQRALTYRSDNQTANHRLGLIQMSARDYQSATVYLQTAFEKDMTNRGVIKNLGYSYLWSGETEKAEALLSRIPEAKHELEVYIWWWNDQRRPDLSDRAAQLATRIAVQP